MKPASDMDAKTADTCTSATEEKETMKNPWLKKNPFMSMWLSGANKVAGAARGLAAATVRREATRASKDAVAEGTRQVLDFGNAALGGATKPKARTKPKPKAKAKARKRR